MNSHTEMRFSVSESPMYPLRNYHFGSDPTWDSFRLIRLQILPYTHFDSRFINSFTGNSQRVNFLPIYRPNSGLPDILSASFPAEVDALEWGLSMTWCLSCDRWLRGTSFLQVCHPISCQEVTQSLSQGQDLQKPVVPLLLFSPVCCTPTAVRRDSNTVWRWRLHIFQLRQYLNCVSHNFKSLF